MRDNLIKSFFTKTIYRNGSIVRIIFGPARGLRYKITPVSRHSAIYGGYERNTLVALAHLVKNNMVVYDIGANCGLISILLSRLVGRSGRVYSFEPVPYLYEEIRLNASLNHIHNINIIAKAVSDTLGLKDFILAENPCQSHILDAGEAVVSNSLRIDTTTLDHFIFSEKNLPAQVVKIDVEGAEAQVLQGAGRLLEKYRPIILSEMHSPSQDVLVGRILMQYNYAAYRLDDNAFVEDLSLGWPSPRGLWGHFVGLPSENISLIRNLKRGA